ncbi:MAG: hypothetical protein ACOC1U_04260 [Spirochaetota bacterium]
MLRSSRLQADVFSRGVVFFTLALLAISSAASAQTPGAGGTADDVPWTALLQTGPDERRGIDLLAPDLTPHWHGRYRVGTAIVDLYYARAPLDDAAGWSGAPCPLRPLRARDAELFYYEDPAGWSLLVHLVAGELPPGVTICAFTDRFIARHRLFEGLALVNVPGEAPIFPAVIEL